MLDDLFVPDPPTGDNSNRIPNTRFVTVAIASAVASVGFPSIAATTVVANPSSATAIATAVTVSNLLDNAIGSAQGALLYRNAATWVVLSPGTNGQLLQTQGAATNPQWVGGKVLLNTLSPNGVASTNDTTSLTTTYNSYEVTFDNVTPASTGATMQMQVATSGANFISATYLASVLDYGNGLWTQTTSTTVINLGSFNVNTTNGPGFNGWLRISNPGSTTTRKMISGNTAYLQSGSAGTAGVIAGKVSAFWDGGNNAITGMNFKFLAGNIATGVIKIYGVL